MSFSDDLTHIQDLRNEGALSSAQYAEAKRHALGDELEHHPSARERCVEPGAGLRWLPGVLRQTRAVLTGARPL